MKVDVDVRKEQWHVRGVVGMANMSLRLMIPRVVPQALDSAIWPPDARYSFTNNGWYQQPFNSRTKYYGWSGVLKQTTNNAERSYLLTLEATANWEKGGEPWCTLHVPPGRAGYPATLLVDRRGEIVPELQVRAGMTAYLLPLNPRMGYRLDYMTYDPAMALMFIGAVGHTPALKRWIWGWRL